MKEALALVALLVVAGAAGAQSTPQPQQPDRKAAPSEPRLNLRLDESDLRSLSRNTSGPPAASEEKSADTLPSLGGDVRPIERNPPPGSGTRRPYPQDSERIN